MLPVTATIGDLAAMSSRRCSPTSDADRGLDVALASWTMALTSAGDRGAQRSGSEEHRRVAAATVRGDDPGLGAAELSERDIAAVDFTRNPASLLHALEVIARDPREIDKVTAATAPLWFEVPERAYRGWDTDQAPADVGGTRAPSPRCVRWLAWGPNHTGRMFDPAHHVRAGP